MWHLKKPKANKIKQTQRYRGQTSDYQRGRGLEDKWMGEGYEPHGLESNNSCAAADTPVCTNVEPEYWTSETYILKKIMRW